MQEAPSPVHRLEHRTCRSLGTGSDANFLVQPIAQPDSRDGYPHALPLAVEYNPCFDKHQSAHEDMNTREIVARNVRRVRVARGMSSEALAAEAGVDRVYLGRIERGIANPTVDLLERLASTLGIELVELFTVPPPETERPAPLPGGRRRRRTDQDDGLRKC